MKIGSRKIKPEKVELLVKDIKKKKELQHLAENFVESYLKKHLASNAKAISFLEKEFTSKAKEYKEIIKRVRAELRRAHSLFGMNLDKREEIFDELMGQLAPLKDFNISKEVVDIHKKLLETHSSTKERLGFYSHFYPKLFKITGKPKSILDLGCGINPLSLPLMKLGKLKYYAYDINEREISLVKKYFWVLSKNNKSFEGVTGILDNLKLNQIKKLKPVDLCLLLKMTDVLDRGQGHKKSEEVISNIPAKFIVVSFPTLTVSGKMMKKPRRKWIELMCDRLGYSFKIINEVNEIFYVVEK